MRKGTLHTLLASFRTFLLPFHTIYSPYLIQPCCSSLLPCIKSKCLPACLNPKPTNSYPLHSSILWFLWSFANMTDYKYGYPYPPPGAYHGPPPVMAPPQYYAAQPPPRREPGFLEGILAALCCCCLLDECCCDPSVIIVD